MREQCPQHESFVAAVTELVGTVSVLSTNIHWMERLGRWVAGLCIAIVGLVLVTIFYAGTMYQQVQNNSYLIKEAVDTMQHFHRAVTKEELPNDRSIL